MTTPNQPAVSNRSWFKWTIVGLIALLNGYAVVLMYARGETIFALLTLTLVSIGIYVFVSERAYNYRYIFPGVVTVFIFIVFPLIYTFIIAFTNYSATNLLDLERVRDYHLRQSYPVEGGNYSFTLYRDAKQKYQVGLKSEDGKLFLSKPIALQSGKQAEKKGGKDRAGKANLVTAELVNELPGQKPETIKTIIGLKKALNSLQVKLPDGAIVQMTSLRNFGSVGQQYTVVQEPPFNDGYTLKNQQTGELMQPDMKLGFYRPVNEQGEFIGATVSPGFRVGVGWSNFLQVLTDPGIKGPFIQIFIWTVVFALLSVLLTLIIGMVLACLVQWEELKGKGMYRLMLILPYAVPAFISILVFKGLFNQNFGELNIMLNSLFGIKPEWFSNPWLAKLMILIVNTWLGYPYIMILCMGLLKAIPQDLYEASAIDGSGPIQNFIHITVPLLMKPLSPLLIAAFSFNFNNFVLIYLLTNGRPDIIGASVPAGTTDLLVTYTYRIAFEGSGQNYGLASAIATMIFLIVGALALLNLRAMKLDNEM